MLAVDLLRSALVMSREGLHALIADIRQKPELALVRPAPGKGNHALWTMGHLCAVEGAIQSSIAGRENPHQDLWARFGPGTAPSSDGAGPSFEELVNKFNDIRQETLAILDRIGDGGLDRPPSVIPPGFEEAMRTIGQTFMLITLHQMVHYGQIADCRRAAGLKPLM